MYLDFFFGSLSNSADDEKLISSPTPKIIQPNYTTKLYNLYTSKVFSKYKMDVTYKRKHPCVFEFLGSIINVGVAEKKLSYLS
ncbi:MAG: hypothetical protein RR536_02765, partial [Anaerovoracaceae bacterium]